MHLWETLLYWRLTRKLCLTEGSFYQLVALVYSTHARHTGVFFGRVGWRHLHRHRSQHLRCPSALFISRQINLAKSKHEPPSLPHHQIILQIAVGVTGPPVLWPQPPAANQLLHLFRVTSLKRRSNGFVTGGLLCCSTCYTTAHHLLSSAWVDIHRWERDVHLVGCTRLHSGECHLVIEQFRTLKLPKPHCVVRCD